MKPTEQDDGKKSATDASKSGAPEEIASFAELATQYESMYVSGIDWITKSLIHYQYASLLGQVAQHCSTNLIWDISFVDEEGSGRAKLYDYSSRMSLPLNRSALTIIREYLLTGFESDKVDNLLAGLSMFLTELESEVEKIHTSIERDAEQSEHFTTTTKETLQAINEEICLASTGFAIIHSSIKNFGEHAYDQVQWMILNFTSDWNKFLRKQTKVQ